MSKRPVRVVDFPPALLWILGLTALVYTIAYFMVITNYPEAIRAGGENSHRQVAYHLLDHGDFPAIHSRPPLYPALIATLYSVFGRDNDVPLIIVLGLVSLVTIFLVYLIGNRLFGRRAGLVGSALMALETCLLYSSYSADLPDVFFTFFVTLGVYMTLRCFEPGVGLPRVALSAGVLASAALVKPVGLYVPFLAACFLGIYAFKNLNRSRALKILAVYLVISGVLVVGWQFRNYLTSGHFVFAPMKGLYLLYTQCYILAEKENIPFIVVKRQVRAEYDQDPEFKDLDEVGQDNHFFRNAVPVIIKHPFTCAYVMVRGILHGTWQGACRDVALIFYSPEERLDIRRAQVGEQRFATIRVAWEKEYYILGFVTIYSKLFSLAFWPVVFAGMLWMPIRQRMRIDVLFLAFFIAYLVLVMGAVGHVRYRLHFEGAGAVFAGALIAQYGEKVVRKLISLVRHLKNEGLLRTLIVSKNILCFHFVKDLRKKKYLLKKIHGMKMSLDVGDPGVSRVLALNGMREADQVYMVRQALKPGMTVVDIGANIGTYALLEASLVGREGKVYALEPSPENFELLNRNVALNGFEDIIETYQIGASNTDGTARFYIHEASNLHTFHPLKYQHYKQQTRYEDHIDVEIVNLCTFLEGKRSVDFLRMDIEGYEVEVLEGIMAGVAAGSLSPQILFESHFPKYDDEHHNMRLQLNGLFDSGYYPKMMASTDESIARFKEKGYQPGKLIRTDRVYRGIYEGVSREDALELICDIGTVRASLLRRA